MLVVAIRLESQRRQTGYIQDQRLADALEITPANVGKPTAARTLPTLRHPRG